MELKSYVKNVEIEDVLTRIGVSTEEYTNMHYSVAEKNLLFPLNERFKDLAGYDEFIQFLNDVNSFGLGFEIRGKRKGRKAYSFSHLFSAEGFTNNPFANNPIYLNKVSYLYDDGVSTGEGFIKNLHKYLEVKL